MIFNKVLARQVFSNGVKMSKQNYSRTYVSLRNLCYSILAFFILFCTISTQQYFAAENTIAIANDTVEMNRFSKEITDIINQNSINEQNINAVKQACQNLSAGENAIAWKNNTLLQKNLADNQNLAQLGAKRNATDAKPYKITSYLSGFSFFAAGSYLLNNFYHNIPLFNDKKSLFAGCACLGLLPIMLYCRNSIIPLTKQESHWKNIENSLRNLQSHFNNTPNNISETENLMSYVALVNVSDIQQNPLSQAKDIGGISSLIGMLDIPSTDYDTHDENGTTVQGVNSLNKKLIAEELTTISLGDPQKCRELIFYNNVVKLTRHLKSLASGQSTQTENAKVGEDDAYTKRLKVILSTFEKQLDNCSRSDVILSYKQHREATVNALKELIKVYSLVDQDQKKQLCAFRRPLAEENINFYNLRIELCEDKIQRTKKNLVAAANKTFSTNVDVADYFGTNPSDESKKLKNTVSANDEFCSWYVYPLQKLEQNMKNANDREHLKMWTQELKAIETNT